MKIAIIAHSHYPIKQPFTGGLEAHTYQLAMLLQLAGHHVTLFAARGSDPQLPYQPFCWPTAVEQFKPASEIVRYRENAYRRLLLYLQTSDFDIVHNNSLHYVPLAMAETLPMPMITVLHTPPFVPMLNGFKKAVAAKNHRVIAVSKAVAALWNNASRDLIPQVIHNGIDTLRWLPSVKQRQENAIWFGRIHADKGTHLAIESAVKSGMPLKLCGPIHDQNYYERYVLPLLGQYSQQVTYLGNLDANTLAKEVARARVFICTPCWEEPFGLVVAESLSCGTPVAGFKRGALPEILTNKTGVLVEEDTTALAKAVAQAMSLSHEDCRRHAVDNYSIEIMARQYDCAYDDAVSSAAR